MKYQPYYPNSEYATLTDEQITAAARHGKGMREDSLNHGYKDGWELSSTEGLYVQCVGAVAEAAACSILNLPINLTAGTYNVADLIGNIQVRALGMDYYGLRIKPSDDPSWRTLAIIIPRGEERSGRYRVPGWYVAGDAFGREDWQMAPNGNAMMYSVPQSELRPVSTLRDLVHNRQSYPINMKETCSSFCHPDAE